MKSVARFTLFVSCFLLPAASIALGQGGPISSENRDMPNPPPTPPRLVDHDMTFRVTFFPPTAPPFGAPISNNSSHLMINGRQIDAPDGLGDFVNEYFYPALGTRLVEHSTPKNFTARLDAYRAARTGLLNELTDQLHLAETADPAASERELRALAASQAPRIAALEKEAEQIRDDLVRSSLFHPTADWNELRYWKLGALASKSPTVVARAEFLVLRAAAYFSKGFSPEQRGLLREIAMEQEGVVRTYQPVPGPPRTTDPLLIFFSPETARLHLPGHLPPALSDQIGIFNHDKAELKNELREAVVTQDRSSAVKRTRYFEDLAERQRPRLAALAALAEEIRHGFADLPKPPLPAAPPYLPPDLLAELKAYRSDKLALDSERSERISAALRSYVPPAANQSVMDIVRQMRTAQAEALKRADEQFQLENAERSEEIQQRGLALRHRVESLAATHIDPATGKPMDVGAFMRALNTADQQFGQLGREEASYKDYHVAMLLPGLSPEQRRLLFGAELVSLAQPLPGPERLPPPQP